MLNIPEVLKNTYRNDMFPFMDEPAPKDLVIYFPALNLTIETDQIVDDSFELNESLCSEEDLVFGSCEASKIKFTVADVEHNLKGQWFTIEQVIDGFDPVPLGVYKVDSCVKQDNLRFKDITAYDKLKDTDVDVSAWYNGLFPNGDETYTLKQFRSSLLAHLGIEEVLQTLPNDDMIVEKTIDPTQISGRTVLEATVELNGAFGHINRLGKFVRIVLQPSYGLYPSETLYPSEDLYPVSETDTSYVQEDIVSDTVSKAMYQSVRFEEYSVKEIDKLQIRAEENDIGAIVGAGTNAYVIEGNFLVFGKSAEELEQIALNAFGNMAKRPYRPYEADSIGLPYVEVGDTLEFATDDTVVGYVLQRTLTGIQALQDKYTAEGNEEREQNFGVNEEIIQLQGKVTRIKKDVEGVSVEVEDLAQNTASKFEQTSQQITAEVNRATAAEGVLSGRIDVEAGRITAEVTRATQAEGELSGQIEVLAGQVVLKVDANGNVAAVELDADPEEGTAIKLTADNIELEGYVSINGYTKINTDGSLEVVNAKISGTLTSPTINGGTITGATFTTTGTYGTVTLANGAIEATVVYADGVIADSMHTTTLGVGLNITLSGATGNVECLYINGYSPVHAGNIGLQSVSSAAYASNAGYAYECQEAYNASRLGYAVYVSSNNNFRPLNDGGASCGTSEGKWTSVWAMNGTIQTSDERKKTDILPLDERYRRFAKMIVPYTFKMVEGTSGRRHVGFIAQRIEEAMQECGISDMEFAGLIKAPVYAEKLKDEDGNEINEYDTSSEIIDYDYSLRYDEFIPLIFAWLRELENKV